MQKTIKFSRLFVPCAILSLVLIIFGVAGLFTKGINFGIDFKAGFIEKVKIAPTAFTLTYDGAKTVVYSQSNDGIDIVSTSVDGDSEALTFPFEQYKTIRSFAEALKDFEGLGLQLSAPEETLLSSVFIGSQTLPRLSNTPFRVYYLPEGSKEISTDEVRNALASVASAAVQQVGNPADRTFQIRLPDDGQYEDANAELRKIISEALNNTYGEDNIAVLSTDFVGSRFSGSLAKQSAWLVLGALILIFVYAMFRFRWDFALGAIFALIHDSLIMLAFIVWVRMEFNSTTIAAILTIIGYSINDTVVIFDRIRENIGLNPKENCVDILDFSLTEVLGRTVITTLTTMLAVVALYVFTDGSMKDFALALLVGMVSGIYSSIYIATFCIALFGKNKKGEDIFKKKTIQV